MPVGRFIQHIRSIDEVQSVGRLTGCPLKHAKDPPPQGVKKKRGGAVVHRSNHQGALMLYLPLYVRSGFHTLLALTSVSNPLHKTSVNELVTF